MMLGAIPGGARLARLVGKDRTVVHDHGGKEVTDGRAWTPLTNRSSRSLEERSGGLYAMAGRVTSMKPGARDYRHKILIEGKELQELQRHTGYMCEAFGLDRKIEKYKGKRSITLFRWDLDCLLAVIELALKSRREYPNQSTQGFIALKNLGDRLSKEYQSVYGEK